MGEKRVPNGCKSMQQMISSFRDFRIDSIILGQWHCHQIHDPC
jgi:hypothetical protein